MVDKWKDREKLLLESSKNSFQHFFLDVFRIEAEDLCHVLRSNIGRVIDIQQIMGRFTLSSIGKIAFGVEDLGKGLSEPPPFAQAFDRAQALCFEIYEPFCDDASAMATSSRFESRGRAISLQESS